MRRFTNEVLEDHSSWLLLDISTEKIASATMAVNAKDWERHEGGRVFAIVSCAGAKYIYASFNRSYKRKRKLILFHHHVLPIKEGLEVDHITHGTMSYVDNRRSNLRLTTRQNNCRNQGLYRRNKSGITGVHWSKARRKWIAGIGVENKLIYLGIYDNIEAAIGARQQAERKYFGEYAYKEDSCGG